MGCWSRRKYFTADDGTTQVICGVLSAPEKKIISDIVKIKFHCNMSTTGVTAVRLRRNGMKVLIGNKRKVVS